jgi:DMSO/TMAO reductase YedYZ molybdopterin-dependent catalytic subunit
VYHRRAVLHIHGNGQKLGLPQNLAAWALASAWRGMPLYPLADPIGVTGRAARGDVTAFDDDLVQH